ncbi:hypothetical protein [Microbacterium oxydans]|uniref:hypothetical protein n=1 Tax=Microbacterium oxydans TaxID=82380 RepID=UPI00367015F9
MPNVLIRDLDPMIHSVLAARAESRGQSLQQYLTSELALIASRPTVPELLAALEERPVSPPIPPEAIVAAIREGRADR